MANNLNWQEQLDQYFDIICQYNDSQEFNKKLTENCKNIRKSKEKMQLLDKELKKAEFEQRVIAEAEKIWRMSLVQTGKKDIYPDLLARGVKDLKLSHYQVARMIDNRNPKITKILNKMIDEKKAIFIAQARAKLTKQDKIIKNNK